MWLLNTETLKLEYFHDHNDVPFAILSHRWRDGEVLFRDMECFDSCSKAGIAKVRAACQLARMDGYVYIWIDTCCIDKSSSAELSEAINSMFRWYADSQICYAYLSDVQAGSVDLTDRQFINSDWFSRCWTLQKLIAPETLIFLNMKFSKVGSKHDLCGKVSTHTGIPEKLLTGQYSLDNYCVAVKMSWASYRHASRTEDYAYSLLGIFGVQMPLIYGERWEAFRRLQKAVLEKTGDLTILIFEDQCDTHPLPKEKYRHTLACEPHQFAKCASLQISSLRSRKHDDISIKMRHDILHLTTFVAKVTSKIYAAYITEQSDRHSAYALLLQEGGTDQYHRLRSPSQLLGRHEHQIPSLHTLCYRFTSYSTFPTVLISS